MDGLLVLCLALLLIAAGLKFKTVVDLRRLRSEQAEVLQKRQRLQGARAQAQPALDRAEIQERELINDVRDLVSELSELDHKDRTAAGRTGERGMMSVAPFGDLRSLSLTLVEFERLLVWLRGKS
jgi:hypothetical protein